MYNSHIYCIYRGSDSDIGSRLHSKNFSTWSGCQGQSSEADWKWTDPKARGARCWYNNAQSSPPPSHHPVDGMFTMPSPGWCQ